jgi:hypothetical protein
MISFNTQINAVDSEVEDTVSPPTKSKAARFDTEAVNLVSPSKAVVVDAEIVNLVSPSKAAEIVNLVSPSKAEKFDTQYLNLVTPVPSPGESEEEDTEDQELERQMREMERVDLAEILKRKASCRLGDEFCPTHGGRFVMVLWGKNLYTSKCRRCAEPGKTFRVLALSDEENELGYQVLSEIEVLRSRMPRAAKHRLLEKEQQDLNETGHPSLKAFINALLGQEEEDSEEEN